MVGGAACRSRQAPGTRGARRPMRRSWPRRPRTSGCARTAWPPWGPTPGARAPPARRAGALCAGAHCVTSGSSGVRPLSCTAPAHAAQACACKACEYRLQMSAICGLHGVGQPSDSSARSAGAACFQGDPCFAHEAGRGDSGDLLSVGRLAACWRRYGVLVLLGEALGASSVVLYGLCIVRRALPPRAPQPGEPAPQPCHVQARARGPVCRSMQACFVALGAQWLARSCFTWCQLARWCLKRTWAIADHRSAASSSLQGPVDCHSRDAAELAATGNFARWWVMCRRARAGADAVLHRGAGHRGRVRVGCARGTGAATPGVPATGSPG
jgi:hypothetical protein